MGLVQCMSNAHDFDLRTNLVFAHRDRSFIKLAKLKLMSMFTDEEVDPIFGKTTVDSLPITTRSIPKSGIISGMASSHRKDSIITGQGEDAPTNAVQPTQERTSDIDHLTKIISELQEDGKSAKRSMEDLKTNFEEELDLLAESVSAFTSRISEVDSLKLQVKTLKRRLQRLEQGNPSNRAPYTVNNDQTEESTKPSRLAKVADMVARKPTQSRPGLAASNRRAAGAKKRAGGSFASNAPDNTSSLKPNSLPTDGMSKTPLKTFSATLVNQQAAHREPGSQSSSSDTDSDVSPIPATRPDTAKFPSPSSISGTSGVALEFEQGPTRTQLTKSRRKPASAGALKSRKVIPNTDMEDEYFMSQPNGNVKNSLGRRGGVPSRGARRVSRPVNLGSRMHDPSLESPDWDGKPYTPYGRKRGIIRRGVGGGRMLSTRSEPKQRTSTSRLEISFTADGQKCDSRGRLLNEAGIPLRPDGKPDRRYLKKTVRDQTGVLRYAPDGFLPNSKKDAVSLAEALNKIEADESAHLTATIQAVAGSSINTNDLPAMPGIGLKRARSEGALSEDRAGIDDLDPRTIKRLRGDDETDGLEEEDVAELSRRWGIRQQSA